MMFTQTHNPALRNSAFAVATLCAFVSMSLNAVGNSNSVSPVCNEHRDEHSERFEDRDERDSSTPLWITKTGG